MTGMLVSLLVVLLCGGTSTSEDACTTHGSGCRAPFGLDIAFEDLFSSSCHLHSICYSCGADVDLSKEDCDKALRSNMYAACAPLSDEAMCRFQADNVFALQTRVVGTNYFHKQYHTVDWCIEHDIAHCLPPSNPTATASSTTN